MATKETIEMVVKVKLQTGNSNTIEIEQTVKTQIHFYKNKHTGQTNQLKDYKIKDRVH